MSKIKDDFESAIQRHIERLNTTSLRAIERQVAEKRVAWLAQNRHRLESLDHPSPRRAYELLFFDYMGFLPDDLPVVSESETRIEWLSLNPCPTLDACRELGLDTREVCRAAYEKSTQARISQPDPQLRFLRSYHEIRPHAIHCRERIVRIDFKEMMSIALQEAWTSKREGNKGYGAVVTQGRRIIGRAHDTAATENDPSLHAEVNAIRQAVCTLGDASLSGTVLFSTCEPCPCGPI